MLLYKIDSVLLGSYCSHSLEVTMEVALVEKSAFKSGPHNILALSQKCFRLLYPAVHAVVMGCNSGDSFKTTDQGVRGGVKIFGLCVER